MSRKPTVGRIVHFQPTLVGHMHPSGAFERVESPPLAALIVFVSEVRIASKDPRVDGVPLVNLAVWGMDGMSGIEEGVAFSPEPMPGCWSWPPRSP